MTVTALVTLEELIEAGVHFGHRCSRWNPKMKPFIYGKRNSIHLINLRETVKGLIRACHFLERLSQSGGEVLFVGTKPQIKELVKTEAQRCGMHYVSERW
ncbi:MAG: 30S ribosomal protein S2, partial [Alphaproteobacteria bacterium]|nr:30S ribosomal protein S2 [Alphaproteobacteria bacterium]